jgi:uncharacterized protein (DUF427 family)
MSVRLRDVITGRLDELRHEPAQKRNRAMLGDHTVVDTTHALLVWEPDLASTYLEPLPDALEVAGHLAFFNERVGIHVDGVAEARPITP